MPLVDVYLTDIRHVSDQGVTPTGDRELISGEANLNNALFHRLITTPGSLIHRPNFGVGIKAFQNTLASLSAQQKLATLIVEQFSLDPRVESVNGVFTSYDQNDPNKTVIVIRYKPIGQDEIFLRATPFAGAP